MQLVVVSGRSGSGKSTVLHVLEDIGFTCIDNLPAPLLSTLAKHNQSLTGARYAISIDARNHKDDLRQLPDIILTPPISDLECQVIFLDASDDTLIKRFSETRRKHPLSDSNTDLKEAISKEKEILKPIFDIADISIDTTDMKYHSLRSFVKNRFISANSDSTSVLFQSFGFKYGIPKDADLVFDVRCLPNPHWQSHLRPLTGKDADVQAFLEQQEQVTEMLQDIQQFVEKWLPQYKENNRSYITISVGCTGGQHRSVYLCEKLTEYFKTIEQNIQCRHRELSQ
jgi:UPF0042 nucleotide-binding protein